MILGCICKICGNKFDVDTKDKTTPRDCPYCSGREEIPKNENIQYTPKCPTCQSPDIARLTSTQKAVSVGLFGLFSGRVRKTFHCNNCKYEW
jgi:hypothetical protein